MPSWDPLQYAAFADERGRPAEDLLARIPLETLSTGADLGCGPGVQLSQLARRWPAARLWGVDTSDVMLGSARDSLSRAFSPEDGTRIILDRADIATWQSPEPLDLIYSNAALHWLDDHEHLFPRLMGMLKGGGVLAVQMPRNYASPAHRALGETLGFGPWRERLAALLRPEPVSAPEVYAEILAPFSARLDLWETVYYHHLHGDDPVFNWVKGTAIRPFLDALPEIEREMFESACAQRLREAYPKRSDGVTVFPFRRVFFVAVKR
jgi:trans-aconitate 2-methyltransferase